MGSTSYLSKSKNTFRPKTSSVGSDKEMNGKMKRSKIRRPAKMNDYGMKRIPDYTELAYKEAVSKLRYYLSGSYAPSVRSYGSPSIKNLDDCDLETDKKYGSVAYPTALTEYKTRPRLTTKYATLYADSLKNYNPPLASSTAIPVPAPTTDVSGGTNPDVVHFIQKQEEYIEQLERESQYCRDELNNLLGKVKEVISENENLHEAQKNKIISRMFHSYNTAESETDDLDDIGDSTGLDSDSKPAPLKTKRVTKTRSTKLEGPNIVFESRISELEAQLAQSKIDLKKVQEENNENKRKLANGLVDSTYIDSFKRQIDNLQRDKNSLESQIAKLKLALEQKDGDLDLKFKRGIDDYEHLREERNNLEAEVRRIKDELANERGKIRELAGEGARRVIQERSAAEQRYTAHFDELAHDLATQYDNVAKLQLDLERQRREENDLKRELSSKNTIIEELRMELKNKSSNLQSDLSHAHAEKASIEEELASARLALERQQRQSKHEINRLNSEIQSLRQRLDRADADLVHSRRENLRLSEQIAALEKELNMKNLTPLSPEKNKNEKELSSVLESMENKHAETVAELESMIHSQNDLMEKLTGECRLLTDKLDDVNRRHKEEMANLQRKVENLGQSLQQPAEHTPIPSNYEAPSTHSTTSFRNNDTSSYPGQDNSRTDPTRHPQISRQPSNSHLGRNSFYSNNTSSPEQLTNIPHENISNTNQEQISNETVDNSLQNIERTDTNNDTVDNTQINAQYEAQQNYADNTQEYVQDPNYTQEYSEENPKYQAEYDQQYDPTQYAGNYNQYPQEQAYDNNAEYGNYETEQNNYAVDPNEEYAAVEQQPVYDSQYVPEQQYTESQPNEMVYSDEKQRTTSPREENSYKR